MKNQIRAQDQTNRSKLHAYRARGVEREKVAPATDPDLQRLVVFTDLDGTLLEATTYQFDAARPALDRLRGQAIPVVICTSKTRAEVEAFRKNLGNHDPFIVENGGALYIPDGYFKSTLPGSSVRDGYRVIEMGVPYAGLQEGLRCIERQVGMSLVGFGDMTVDDIAKATGLSLQGAELARQREYDEPFLIEYSHLWRRSIRRAAQRLGLAVIPGSRFFHLVGGTDKGRACRVLIDLYRKEWGSVFTAALGDSLNDLPMLEVVDLPFLVERPWGGHAEGIALEGLTRLQGIGPAGWAEGIDQLLGPSPFQPEPFIFHPFPFAC